MLLQGGAGNLQSTELAVPIALPSGAVPLIGAAGGILAAALAFQIQENIFVVDITTRTEIWVSFIASVCIFRLGEFVISTLFTSLLTSLFGKKDRM